METMAVFSSLDDMRRNQQLCDVVLEVDEEKQFPVHRVILAANSLYFRALFTNGMTESKENVIKIPDVSADLMERILEYAYTRETTITEQNVGKLLPVADQFNFKELVDMCSRFLIKQLSPENCIGIWRYAKSYFCFKLEKEAFEFTLVHFEETALQTESTEFQTLTVDEFEEILLQDRLNVKMEEYVFEAVLKWIGKDEEHRKGDIHRLLLHLRLGMINTDYFMNNIKRHEHIRNSEECKPIVVQTIHYTYNFNGGEIEGPSSVISRPRLPYQLMFSIGGWSGGSPTSAIECYDTRADRWVLVDTVNNRPRAYMGIAVIGRKIYAVGGFDSNQYFNSVRCFNPVTKSWKEVAPMNSRRCYVSVAVLGGHLYAMGGFDGHTRLRSVERFNPQTNQWTMMRPMNHHRSDACATRHHEYLIIVGGFNGSECLSSVELYDPRTDEWRDLPRMLSRRSGVGVVSFRDYAYAVGGFNGLTRLNTMERWKIGLAQWETCPSMYIHRSNFGVSVLDDMIFVIGGFNGITTIYNVECFDPDNNEWYDACDMNVYRSALSVGVVNGLPNVEDFTWPRDRQLPPPTLTPSHANMEQTADLQHDHNTVAAAILQHQQQQQQNDQEQQRDGRRQPRQNQQPAQDQPAQEQAPEVADDNGGNEQEDAPAAPPVNEDVFDNDEDADFEDVGDGDDIDEEDEDDDDDDDDEDDEEEDEELEEQVQFPERPPNIRRHPVANPIPALVANIADESDGSEQGPEEVEAPGVEGAQPQLQ